MKYVLVNTDLREFGAFDSVQEVEGGYDCDGAFWSTNVTGVVSTVKEVADDYMTPDQIESYNTQQSANRAKAYPVDSDPIFFQWQRGYKTQQDWDDAVAAVQAQYPYKTVQGVV